MIENYDYSTPSHPLAVAFEQLPTREKLSVFEDVLAALSDDLGRFNDPVLGRELDVMGGLCSNLQNRLQELVAVYGMQL